MTKFITFFVSLIFICNISIGQQKHFKVIAYYAGPAQTLDSFEVEKLDEIIFSFAHLKGNLLNIINSKDSATLEKMISLKKT